MDPMGIMNQFHPFSIEMGGYPVQTSCLLCSSSILALPSARSRRLRFAASPAMAQRATRRAPGAALQRKEPRRARGLGGFSPCYGLTVWVRASRPIALSQRLVAQQAQQFNQLLISLTTPPTDPLHHVIFPHSVIEYKVRGPNELDRQSTGCKKQRPSS